jgi:hypothetical protein
MTLTEFLTARLDEDEARAWAVHDIGNCDDMLYEENMAAWAERAGTDCACGYPARVLREVEAKRQILAEWHDGNTYGPDRNLSMLLVAQALAAVYSDHPDYDPAWT